MQCSWFSQNLLFDLCEEINRIGGHALNRYSRRRAIRTEVPFDLSTSRFVSRSVQTDRVISAVVGKESRLCGSGQQNRFERNRRLRWSLVSVNRTPPTFPGLLPSDKRKHESTSSFAMFSWCPGNTCERTANPGTKKPNQTSCVRHNHRAEFRITSHDNIVRSSEDQSVHRRPPYSPAYKSHPSISAPQLLP